MELGFQVKTKPVLEQVLHDKKVGYVSMTTPKTSDSRNWIELVQIGLNLFILDNTG